MSELRSTETESLRAALGEACTRLREINNSFNLARLLMTDPALRAEAGEWVKENKAFLDRAIPLVLFKREAVSALDVSEKRS